ncbi:MAG TPA: ABC transporter substrate-binding protein, partial [Tenuifilaceae bacterium]|nr:ABC transporter substrate-binding protein [Tenuifilaceae bacterium]
MVKRIFKLLSIALISISQNYSVFGQTPTRIVSLAPSLTKNVYFLEQQHKLVGCTSYCDTAVAN